MGIGERIRERRKSMGLSRAALAHELNVRRGFGGTDPKTVQRWEAESAEPRLSTALQLADALGVDLRWLITGAEAA